MGIARQNPEFVTDRCLCSKVFKGQNGRQDFNMHALECKHQIALRIANGAPNIQFPEKIGMDNETIKALEKISSKFSDAAQQFEEKKK